MPPAFRRKYIAHAAHATIGVSAGAAAWEAAGPQRRWAGEKSAGDPPPSGVWPLEVWLVAASVEYRAVETLTESRRRLEIAYFSGDAGCSGALE